MLVKILNHDLIRRLNGAIQDVDPGVAKTLFSKGLAKPVIIQQEEIKEEKKEEQSFIKFDFNSIFPESSLEFI